MIMPTMMWLYVLFVCTESFVVVPTASRINKLCCLQAAPLRPAAESLMDAGKRFARSGEFLIDLTTAEGLYGGALSAAGAQIRNAGDSIAQAAASCRFKTGTELVIDEFREAGTCLLEATSKLKTAVEEAKVDERTEWSESLLQGVKAVEACAILFEQTGAAILQKEPPSTIGALLVEASDAADTWGDIILSLAPERREAQDAWQRMNTAAEQLKLAGNELQGIKPAAATGKGWLKGGR